MHPQAVDREVARQILWGVGEGGGNETSDSATVDRLLDWLKTSQVSRGAPVLGQVYVKHFAFEELPAPSTQVI